jgi:pimeloyl-ACP methyl ester carboxylesterase
MNARLVRIVTKDKLVLHGLLYTPDSPTRKIILHIHGMGGNFYENHFLDFMSNRFTDHGYAFLSVNTRGHELVADFALATPDKEEYKRVGVVNEIFEESEIDIQGWMDFIEQEGFTNIFLQGHSLGCAKVAHYLSKARDVRVKKLILLSPADMVGLTEKYTHFKEMMDEAKRFISEGKEFQILSHQLDDWYFMSAKTFLDYSVRGNPIDVFNTYDPEAESRLKDITIPTFALFGDTQEAYITPTPERALEIIKQKATGCPDFVMKVVSGASHSYRNYEQEVADAVMEFINA